MITIDPNYVQIGLTAALVSVTIVYACRTHVISKATKEQAGAAREQANASIKMAEVAKEQLLAMFKPHITMTIRTSSSLHGNYFATKIPLDLQNAGPGCALNVKVLARHPVFRFDSINYPNPIEARQTTSRYTLDLHLENDENRPGIEQPVILITNYEDALGNHWHSKSELLYDASSKGLKLGRLQVALSGYFDSGECE